jgi:hypothetical protein
LGAGHLAGGEPGQHGGDEWKGPSPSRGSGFLSVSRSRGCHRSATEFVPAVAADFVAGGCARGDGKRVGVASGNSIGWSEPGAVAWGIEKGSRRIGNLWRAGQRPG